MGCLKIFLVKGKKPQGGGQTPPPIAWRVKFRILDPKIQMQRAKCDTYLLTYTLTYLLTDYPSHRISYKLIENFSLFYIENQDLEFACLNDIPL